jgi:excisionase family DNA binding protein
VLDVFTRDRLWDDLVEAIDMSEPWLGVQQIAKHLHVSKETVYRWIERQEIPCCRLGKKWMFKASHVDEWIITSTKQPVKRRINGGRK